VLFTKQQQKCFVHGNRRQIVLNIVW